MGPEGVILVNPPITTFQQSLTHSALVSFQSQIIAGTATLTVQNTMTLGRGTHSTRGDLQIKWLIVI